MSLISGSIKISDIFSIETWRQARNQYNWVKKFCVLRNIQQFNNNEVSSSSFIPKSDKKSFCIWLFAFLFVGENSKYVVLFSSKVSSKTMSKNIYINNSLYVNEICESFLPF